MMFCHVKIEENGYIRSPYSGNLWHRETAIFDPNSWNWGALNNNSESWGPFYLTLAKAKEHNGHPEISIAQIDKIGRLEKIWLYKHQDFSNRLKKYHSCYGHLEIGKLND